MINLSMWVKVVYISETIADVAAAVVVVVISDFILFSDATKSNRVDRTAAAQVKLVPHVLHEFRRLAIQYD